MIAACTPVPRTVYSLRIYVSLAVHDALEELPKVP